MSDRRTNDKDRELASQGYPRTLKPDQACEILGVHRRTLYSLVKAGELEAFRLRSQLRIERRDVAHYIRISRAKS